MKYPIATLIWLLFSETVWAGPIGNQIESSIAVFDRLFGGYSIEKHMMVVLIFVLATTTFIAGFAYLRSGRKELAAACAVKTVKGFAWMLLLFTAPYGLLLVGQALYEAAFLTAEPE